MVKVYALISVDGRCSGRLRFDDSHPHRATTEHQVAIEHSQAKDRVLYDSHTVSLGMATH